MLKMCPTFMKLLWTLSHCFLWWEWSPTRKPFVFELFICDILGFS